MVNIKTKTISVHYGISYNLANNNRDFIPHNVDRDRISWNYNCAAAGHLAPIDPDQPQDIREFWERYKILNDIYWSDRAVYKASAYQEYMEHLEYIRRRNRALYELTNNPVGALLALFLLPLIIAEQIHLQHEFTIAKEEYEAMLRDQQLRDLTHKATQKALRDSLKEHDLQNGTRYLSMMDRAVSEMAAYADDYLNTSTTLDAKPQESLRYATLEEIYDRFYEPSFKAFQSKQRPCRRYNGTYLEQIREQQAKQTQRMQQTPNSKSRCTVEAIELVIGIGDMDNTRYSAAYSDAKKSEELLRDYCDHLLVQPNICFITTRELNNPGWQPPFKNGLTIHTDEATPGIHLTCIPYSWDCKRGPAVQASMGRAMAGMGYQSTWKDVLDENGNRIPKRNKSGEIIHNKDGSIRYKQEPDGQGIIDWIEDQKRWIQHEMMHRYDWSREYKGSHPRGNLSTPDYQAARAKERQEESERLILNSLENYQEEVYQTSLELYQNIKPILDGPEQEIIERYLSVCSDEEYQAIYDRAATYLDKLAANKMENTLQSLSENYSSWNRGNTKLIHRKNTPPQI